MTGTENQIEWAKRIKTSIQAEFDRVENALRTAASNQQEQDRADTLDIIAILDAKRSEVIATSDAGYFIRVWQEMADQVRQLITQDVRYQSIQTKRRAKQFKRTNDTGTTHAV